MCAQNAQQQLWFTAVTVFIAITLLCLETVATPDKAKEGGGGSCPFSGKKATPSDGTSKDASGAELPTSATPSAESSVVVLDDESFEREVLGSTSPWLVEFYQEDCEPCKKFSPEFAKAASSLNGIVKVGALDCNPVKEVKDKKSKKGKEKKVPSSACVGAGIRALPAVKFYTWERQKNPYTGKWYKDPPIGYDGDMKAKKVVEFASALLPGSFVNNVSSGASADTFLKGEANVPKVLLFSAKEAVAPLYKSLALQFRGRLQFAQAKSSDEALSAKYDVQDFPSLLVLKVPEGPDNIVKYDGPMKALPIGEFLLEYALPAAPDAAGEEQEADGRQEKPGGPPEKADPVAAREKWVKKLRGAEFEKTVMTSEDVWLVAFLGSSDGDGCPEKIEEWKAASMDLVGMVRMAELETSADEEAHKLAEKYGVADGSCISLLLFEFGEEKSDQEPEVFMGEMNEKELSAFALSAIPDVFVQHLNDVNVDSFVNLIPQKPKVLLFTAKTETSNLFKTLATNFREYIAFGQIHSSQEELVKRFNVQQIPRIVFLVARPSDSSMSQLEMTLNQYSGPLKYPVLASVMNQLASLALGMEGFPVKDLELKQVTNDEEMGELCLSQGKLCAIGLFRGPGKVDDLQKVAAIWASGGQFSFFWLDLKDYPGFTVPLGIPQDDLPTVIVFSPAKRRLAIMSDDFSSANVQAFLEALLGGRERTVPLQSLPSLAASTVGEAEETPEAAEDAAPVEEEFSLDDILGEEIEGGADALGTKSKRLEEVERELEEEERKRKEEEEAAKAAAKAASKKKKKVVKKKKAAAAKEEL
eukprot:TRINITY_DN10300_c0_g1_i1.p1 TRINITY_DN10300_c0_g1~~TRINITY_DN10300_c0_g1_i1.p1  ORF type:complete len:814 (-),score=241.05 TRINITY_DN10300_c0_g1_i1:681-3122(-)